MSTNTRMLVASLNSGYCPLYPLDRGITHQSPDDDVKKMRCIDYYWVYQVIARRRGYKSNNHMGKYPGARNRHSHLMLANQVDS